MGGDDPSIHFDGMEGQGARVAMPIYALFMKKVFADKHLGYTEDETFEIPDEYKDPCSSRGRRGENDNSNQRNASGFDLY